MFNRFHLLLFIHTAFFMVTIGYVLKQSRYVWVSVNETKLSRHIFLFKNLFFGSSSLSRNSPDLQGRAGFRIASLRSTGVTTCDPDLEGIQLSWVVVGPTNEMIYQYYTYILYRNICVSITSAPLLAFGHHDARRLKCAKDCNNLLNLDIKQGDGQIRDRSLSQPTARNSHRYSY